MFYRLRTDLNRRRFDHQAAGIENTPPLSMKDGPLRIVSLLQSRDVRAYLVAVKGFYRQIGAGDVLIVNDGTLTSADIDLLGHHIPRLAIRPITDGQLDGLPRGGCWERLAVIGLEAQNHYVIQLDADIVCTGPVPEVMDGIRENRGFALADGPEPGWKPAHDIGAFMQAQPERGTHIQDVAEEALADADLDPADHYLKATAAFAGFPRGTDFIDRLQRFHAVMSNRLGARWTEWGSEQVASNYIVANTGKKPPAVLVPPRYFNHLPDSDLSAASLVHFFGTYRFYRNRYGQMARTLISDLSGP